MDRSRARTGFTVLLFSLTGLLFIQTMGLGRVARLVPLKVLVPTLVLLALQLALDLFPALGRRFSPFERVRFVKADHYRDQAKPSSTAPDPGRAFPGTEGRLFLWLLLFPVLIYFSGFPTAAPLYLFLFLKVRSGESLVLSAASAAVMWGFLLGVFTFLLDVPLHRGLLWRWLGL